MADDTRNSAIKEDLSREALTVDPAQKAFSGAQWQDTQAQGYQPPQNANMMPGGTENTAGGQTKEIGLGDAIESIKMEDFTVIHKKPCVRDALMVGIGSGFGVGGLKALVSHRGPSRSRYGQVQGEWRANLLPQQLESGARATGPLAHGCLAQ